MLKAEIHKMRKRQKCNSEEQKLLLIPAPTWDEYLQYCKHTTSKRRQVLTQYCCIELKMSISYTTECNNTSQSNYHQYSQEYNTLLSNAQQLCQALNKTLQGDKGFRITTVDGDGVVLNHHIDALCGIDTVLFRSLETSCHSRCTLTWLAFTKWFYFSSQTAKALGKCI